MFHVKQCLPPELKYMQRFLDNYWVSCETVLLLNIVDVLFTDNGAGC